MANATDEVRELRARLAEMQGEIARMAERLAQLDGQPAEPAAVASAPPPIVEEGISEDVVLVLAAAIAAYLGKRAHIRQIRLLGSAPWAQQGRVSIQASHRLDGGTGW